MQEFQTLAVILGKAFGGSKPKPKAISSNQELESAFSAMYGPGAVR